MPDSTLTDRNSRRQISEDLPPKRRRVPIACNSCRAKKSRCDGDQPSCAMCRDHGIECTYLRTPIHPVSEDSSQIEELKERLRALETLVASSTATSASLESLLTVAAPVPGRGLPRTSVHQISLVNSHEPGGFARSLTGESPNTVAASQPVDGMGAVILENEEILTFFGPSSNITFTRHITQMVARLGHLANPWTSSVVDNPSLTFLNIPHSPLNVYDLRKGQGREVLDPFALPSQHQMEQLIGHYFSDTGLLFPNLHRPSFLESYVQMKEHGPTSMRRTWLAMLNMVLALATITIDRDDAAAETRAAEAQKYYERAAALCDVTVLSGTSLEVVQYLILVTHYLQATQTSVRTSNALSLAVSAAIRLGLHTRQAAQTFSPLEQELRNRTWFVCIILDRVLSMTLGRPAIIPFNYVKLDLPRNIESAQQSGLFHDQNTEYSVGVFTATIKLYQIMWKVIDQQYGQNLGFDSPPSVVDVISPLSRIDNELREWDRELPLELRTITSSELWDLLASYDPAGPTAKAKRFQVVLTLRYLNLTILLHRPVLVKYFELASSSTTDPSEMSLLNRLGRNSIDVCFRCSKEIIFIVSTLVQNAGPSRGLLNAWWFTLYYTFNAGLVIAGIMLACQDSNLTIPDAPSKFACKECLERAAIALAHLDAGNRIIARCHDYLQRLIGAIETLTFKPPELPASEFRHLSPTGAGSNAFLSTPDLMFSPASTSGNGVSSRNVGDLMTGNDLSFLNFYFAPTGGAPAENNTTKFPSVS
ncbi:uncharacterized protein Z518_09072 [Rhinocladiella mackenziei CBS 650.93]|uniref:Rhinocladiella mackenziei CBS 650.93 unplaced genomic scaffold supercont1.7, whole genome shotgun sequence n=1 Tax=Rhinocladiella mackenziei CBS 650.93 TaxID=1442369 RepID=A0A0D2FH34_9EURO|nr:uncharacterized protein Z518_09072 [Rhinocladiella mackenziei CBS 650.93]KIX01347.1 hypothetical protein Z518_09072 [Rhinocladiella mackenziei CBS 650.93]